MRTDDPVCSIALDATSIGFGCSRAARGVAVEAEEDVVGVLAQFGRLLRRKGRSERRHGVLEARLMQGDAVEVALDDDERAIALRRACAPD